MFSPGTKKGYYRAICYSRPLASIVITGAWKDFIRCCDLDRKEFLRASFNGDGVAVVPSYANSDVDLLNFIREILMYFKIQASAPVVVTSEGTTWCVDHHLTRRKTVYAIFIHPNDYEAFIKKIGTSILRKQRLLSLSLAITDSLAKVIEGKENWGEVLARIQRVIAKKVRRKPSTP